MQFKESEKLADILAEQGGEVGNDDPTYVAMAHRGFNGEGEDTSRYLELGIRLGSAANELQGRIFFADIGNVRYYVVATSEDQACEMVRFS